MKFSLFFDEDKTIERKKLMQSFYDAPAFLYPNDRAVESVNSAHAPAEGYTRMLGLWKLSALDAPLLTGLPENTCSPHTRPAAQNPSPHYPIIVRGYGGLPYPNDENVESVSSARGATPD